MTPNLSWEVVWKRPRQYNAGLVALLPENILLPEFLESMARESYRLAPREESLPPSPSRAILKTMDLSTYVTPDAKADQAGTRVVLDMDVVNDVPCRTQVMHLTSPVFEFNYNSEPQRVDLRSLGLRGSGEYLIFDAELFRARGDPEQFLYQVRKGLRGEVDF